MIDRRTCVQIQCGCVSQDSIPSQELYDCTSKYGSGVFNPALAPCPEVCPETVWPPVLQTPKIVYDYNPAYPTLTPFNIVQPFPDITRALEPVETEPSCSLWCDLNGYINQHPFISLGILAGIAALMNRRSRR